jgi:superfamily II DNA or RNA helicase
MILRPYQLAAVKAALASTRHALLALPTGTGKTVIIAEICRRTDGRVIVLAHRSELLDQAAEKISAHCGELVGRVQAEVRQFGYRLTVASVASMHEARRAQIQRPQILIIDEAHHAPAASYREVIDWAQAQVIGVTATPYRADEGEDGAWKLGAIFGRMPAYVYPLMDAVRDGYLVPIRQWGVATESSLDGVGMSHGDLAASGLLTLDNPERNILVADSYRRLCDGRQAIVFACGVQHAQNLATALKALDVPAEAIWGDMDTSARAEALARYRRGELRAICNCGILTEGFDDPATSALLMARPTASRGLYTQMAGRGLRPHEASGKRDCVIVDFLDAGRRHALSLQSAVRLAGAPGEVPIAQHDARGRVVTEVSAEMMAEHLASVADVKARIAVMPLAWTAKDITPRWSAEKLSLAGYAPQAHWELKPASPAQIKMIGGFKLTPQRDLTRGEASALIDRLLTLDAAEPEMATEKQARFLAWKGLARYEDARRMTKREAKRVIGKAMAGGKR